VTLHELKTNIEGLVLRHRGTWQTSRSGLTIFLSKIKS